MTADLATAQAIVAGRALDRATRRPLQRVSVAALRTTDPRFSESVHEALYRMRFHPAEMRGQKVAQLVEQRFTFALH